MFNSLRYTKLLEESGVPRNQAEAHVEVLADMMVSHFATTQDLKDLSRDLRTEIKDLEYQMQKLEHRLTIKLGAIVVSTIGIFGTIMTLVLKLT
jgi:hypothetical protein